MSRCDLAAYITKPSLPASWVSTYTGLRKCSLDDCALAGTAARPADASTAAAESRRRDLRIAVPSERVGTRFDEAGIVPASDEQLRKRKQGGPNAVAHTAAGGSGGCGAVRRRHMGSTGEGRRPLAVPSVVARPDPCTTGLADHARSRRH